MPFDTSGLPQPPDARSWSFTEGFSAETLPLAEARKRSIEIKAHFVSPATGGTLRMLAAAIGAQHVVEIGTSTGGAMQWILQALPDDGQITSIDVDGEHHRIAKELLASADEATHRTRLITGRPTEVLPRLSDRAYDMVLIASDALDLNTLLDQAIRLLRVNGLVVLIDAFGGGKVGDPAQRDAATVNRRLLVQRINHDPRLTSALLPVGDGLLVAVVREHNLPADFISDFGN